MAPSNDTSSIAGFVIKWAIAGSKSPPVTEVTNIVESLRNVVERLEKLNKLGIECREIVVQINKAVDDVVGVGPISEHVEMIGEETTRFTTNIEAQTAIITEISEALVRHWQYVWSTVQEHELYEIQDLARIQGNTVVTTSSSFGCLLVILASRLKDMTDSISQQPEAFGPYVWEASGFGPALTKIIKDHSEAITEWYELYKEELEQVSTFLPL